MRQPMNAHQEHSALSGVTDPQIAVQEHTQTNLETESLRTVDSAPKGIIVSQMVLLNRVGSVQLDSIARAVNVKKTLPTSNVN